MNPAVKTYKGYEIHPLVYPHRPAGAQTSRDPGAGYDASVRICRVGANAAADGRVFRLQYLFPFDGMGKARIACMAHAERLIDGQVNGQSVADL
ncbi:hypothetical protein GXB81_30080 [Paraburkholderia sp. Ac-20336]|uniref:hypothetical protein n=1 Tax=Burkholderiaceae TaxID=119060 RepID=UPI001422F7C8|nr:MULTISPECIES: hypothetical protein [Burkholderiaceae]MBN3807254.1 hypothetical protein [Paraburkholderia sp. Ac-20336]MBN3851494.1 hypothetical protein [Paraburkholderia sp. Ac-20342]NIF52887.1 hypothetical protein [Burkholderia sp. Ax-1724]NIF78827.1 hypothetical protein [Paraburkholderia sp. Cy-641]